MGLVRLVFLTRERVGLVSCMTLSYGCTRSWASQRERALMARTWCRFFGLCLACGAPVAARGFEDVVVQCWHVLCYASMWVHQREISNTGGLFPVAPYETLAPRALPGTVARQATA